MDFSTCFPGVYAALRLPGCYYLQPSGLMMNFRFLIGPVFVVGAMPPAAELRIGIIGCDTSHVTAFTETLNNTGAAGHVPGGNGEGLNSGLESPENRQARTPALRGKVYLSLRKFLKICRPFSVRILSGWNCTPQMGYCL